ncbi:hypothetical protein JMJ58_06370 [Haloterrigena salifodinae]|uniref:Uncharacterized protein n=1 Tax=Haloterrigena salifodinae TaxID=2675099 RepID=A0A8T8E473_9EURY|nr:hypothetical protein [Haloterrigena salifodinae]QRV16509.1 hypothetical protein JMJ58_06370 [Haloterrigena salifodinae]
MAGFEIINESDEKRDVSITVTSTEGETIHESSHKIDAGWSRLTKEEVFESQPCQYEVAVDQTITDTYSFSPSCADFEDTADNLAIVLNPPEIEYFPKKCGGG